LLILYLKLPDNLDQRQWKNFLFHLPIDWQREINGFKHWRDRQARLLGKLLVGYGLERFASVPAPFADLKRGEWGRPYVECNWDFNLSYSDDYLVMGMISGGRIGVDVEKIKDIDLADFQSFFNPEIWQEIVAGKDPLGGLFHFWTRIESVLKADGRGMFFPSKKVSTKNHVGYMDGRTWYLHDFLFIPGHACCAAMDLKEEKVKTIKIEFHDLALKYS
jgi:4'-phosphopantetheinyl transferase